MLVIEIPEKTLVLRAPENATECTTEQYVWLLTCYARLIRGELSPDTFLVRLSYGFLNLRAKRKKEARVQRSAMTAEARPGEKAGSEPLKKHVNLWRIAQQFGGFLSSREDGSVQVNIRTLKQHFPKIRRGKHVYVGAADALTSLTFIEFIHLDMAARTYAETKEQGHLDLLTALIYRKRAPWWRRLFGSEGYDAAKTEAQAKLSPLPQLYQLAALNLYQSTLHWWQEGPIEISGTEVDLRLLWTGSGKTDKSTGSLTTVLFSLAESGVFGTVKQTSEANLYDVLLRLYQVAQQAKEAEQKAKEKKK